MKSFKDEAVRSIAMELAEEGKKLINIAYESREFKNRTYNLHDSYGSCVFYNGKEYPNTRRYVGKQATVWKTAPDGTPVLGRNEVDKFFDEYRCWNKGFTLVTVAAIFYAGILELKYKYQVISGLNDSMNSLAKKYKGTVKDINM